MIVRFVSHHFAVSFLSSHTLLAGTAGPFVIRADGEPRHAHRSERRSDSGHQGLGGPHPQTRRRRPARPLWRTVNGRTGRGVLRGGPCAGLLAACPIYYLPTYCAIQPVGDYLRRYQCILILILYLFQIDALDGRIRPVARLRMRFHNGY